MLDGGVECMWGERSSGSLTYMWGKKTTGPGAVGGFAEGPLALLTPRVGSSSFLLVAGGSRDTNSLYFLIYSKLSAETKVLDWGGKRILQLARWVFSFFCAQSERVNNVWFHWCQLGANHIPDKGKLNIATISKFDGDSHTTLLRCLYLTLIND